MFESITFTCIVYLPVLLYKVVFNRIANRVGDRIVDFRFVKFHLEHGYMLREWRLDVPERALTFPVTCSFALHSSVQCWLCSLTIQRWVKGSREEGLLTHGHVLSPFSSTILFTRSQERKLSVSTF